MEKGLVLKNLLDGTTTVDTLHFQAEVNYITKNNINKFIYLILF